MYLRKESHLNGKRHLVLLDRDESAVNVELLLSLRSTVLHLSLNKRRDYRGVVVENLETSKRTWNENALRFALIHYFLRTDYLKFQHISIMN